MRSVATFMGFAQVDLRPGTAAKPYLEEVKRLVTNERFASLADKPLWVWVREGDARTSVSFLADYGNVWLAELVVEAASVTGTIERAIIGLDHNEYGIEHIVLSGLGGDLCRLQHVYVAPEPGCVPTLGNLPGCAGVEFDSAGSRLGRVGRLWRWQRHRLVRIVDGPRSWEAVAALYGVGSDRVYFAAQKTKKAHEDLGMVFTPFEQWWAAVGATYPADLGPPDITLVPAKAAD